MGLKSIYVNKETEEKLSFILQKDNNLKLSGIFSKAVDELFSVINSNHETKIALELQVAERKLNEIKLEYDKKVEAFEQYKKKKEKEELNLKQAIANKELETIEKKKSNFRDLIENRDKQKFIQENLLNEWVSEFISSNLLIGDFLKNKGYEIRDYQLCKIGGTK